ncbi:MAG: RluA family pseudouridine synthase [Deltaproteobacteria bacterium]|nr:RluA family pseudouridine synthase [Deltaproteobacteria bacterium]
MEIIIDQGKIRLDSFLAKKYPNLTRSQIKKRIHFIQVNSRSRKPSYLLSEGDRISIQEDFFKEKELVPYRDKIDIIYEDKDLLVVNKPSGLLTHPTSNLSADSLANRLISHYKNLPILQGEDRPGIVHRLDRDTSGLVLVAKNENTQKKLIDLFKTKAVLKTYITLVWGVLKSEAGIIDSAIERGRINRTKMKTSADGRYAETHWKVLEEFEKFSLLEISPKTGRTHQIRVHMKELNHPVVGDRLYGGGHSLKIMDGIKRQLLHAWKLEFEHPTTNSPLQLTAPLPNDFAEVLSMLKSKHAKSF